MNWDAALAEYDRDLRARGAAERTRRAYGGRPRRLRRVGEAAGPRPRRRPPPRRAPLRRRALRRRARPRPRSPASWPRSAASTASWSAPSGPAGNPAELVSSPKRSEKLPKVLTRRADARRCWSGSRPGRRSSCATGRCSSSPTPAACAARRSSTSTSARSTSKTSSCGCSARARRSGCCRSASRRSGRSNATSSAAAARSPTIRASGRCSSPRAAGASPTPTSPGACGSGPRGCPRRRRLATFT